MKKKKDIPVAYETEYYEYETIENEESDTDVSDLESDISDKNDQDVILKEVEEMNNKYSFLKINTKNKTEFKKSKQPEKKTEELQEEAYLTD